MNSVVIVAIPKEDDYVNNISSEKVPHMTLLFLGEASGIKNLATILDYVKHAADQTLNRFELQVDHRGELGPESADVLFFSTDKWSGIECVANFRSFLLKEPNIKTAYDSTEQFPEWTPHLTLGYPATPAKEDTRDYPGFSYVSFDRIAVWFGDSEGIEFPLKKYDWSLAEVAYMSDLGRETTEGVLAHYGKKGMKWGVRNAVSSGSRRAKVARSRRRASQVTVTDKSKSIKTVGGKGLPAHPDAIRARTIGQKTKASGVKALSDSELRDYANRLQLEQNVHRLNFNEKSAPSRFISSFLGKQGSRAANETSKAGATKLGTSAVNAATRKSIRIARTAAAVSAL